MAYFVFIKNCENLPEVLYRIAENESDLNNLNIIQSDYKIIEDSQDNFNSVKLNNKTVSHYLNNTIYYQESINYFADKIPLTNHVEETKQQVLQFLNNNKTHPSYTLWNNYYNQLNNLNLDTITYPLTKSLPQYFNDLGQLSLNTLQIP